MARTQRRRRIRCRLPCQIVQQRGRGVEAAILRISEAGFGLETTERFDQGDSIRVRIRAQGAVPAVEVQAIVWYDNPAPRSLKKGALRLLGCVLPDRSPAFLDLFAAIERRNAPAEPPRRAEPTRSAPKLRTEDVDLPRSRDPLPPPKPEPEESLPTFRVRLRQIGGPRTRCVSVQACSPAQAAERALSRISSAAAPDTERWEVSEVTPSGGSPARREP